MGSLMAGWDSPVLRDDKQVRLMRNRSLTKEEVEAFRRQQHRKPAVAEDNEVTITPQEKRPLSSRRSPTSSPLARGDKIDVAGDDAAGAGESPKKSLDWWTRSSWAFLNEPPQEDAAHRTAQNYTPQFHVVGGRVATGKA